MPPPPAPVAAKPQSHRIYWQQRLSGSSNSNGISSSVNSNNNLITGSAAVKISHSARACDLTNLLRKTLHLGTIDSNKIRDSLVLVGTLRSVPNDYVRFEHEQEPHSSHNNENEANDELHHSGSSMTEDFHVVKTLDANDLCLSVLQDMKAQLLQRQRAIDIKVTKAREAASATRRNLLSLRPTIAPQTRWYYVPDTSTESSSSNQPTMSSCLELDGYLTSFDEDESDDENDCNSENDPQTEALHSDDEDLLRRVLAPFDDETNSDSFSTEQNEPTMTEQQQQKQSSRTNDKTAREWRRYLQISQSHAAADKANTTGTSTLAGFLLKCSSRDPHVWKRHYCVLTQDDFWYVPRLIRPDEVLPNNKQESSSPQTTDQIDSGTETREIEIARFHGRISLAEATLLDRFQAKTRKDGFEVVSGDGTIHKFRACSPTLSAGAATLASIASANEWQRMLQIRIRDAQENSLIKHAELLLTEETVARNDRWRNFLLEENEVETPSLLKNFEFEIESSSSLNRLRSSVLQFGLDVAEYKEGCRQIQTLLWADMARRSSSSSSSETMGAIKKLLKELWREASMLLDRALQLNSAIVGDSQGINNNNTLNPHRRGLETMCHHIEYVITQKRKSPSQISLTESNSTDSLGTTNEGERKYQYDLPHQRDPPPIDLFDLLWNELRTLG